MIIFYEPFIIQLLNNAVNDTGLARSRPSSLLGSNFFCEQERNVGDEKHRQTHDPDDERRPRSSPLHW
jgi:hypothetical protein